MIIKFRQFALMILLTSCIEISANNYQPLQVKDPEIQDLNTVKQAFTLQHNNFFQSLFLILKKNQDLF